MANFLENASIVEKIDANVTKYDFLLELCKMHHFSRFDARVFTRSTNTAFSNVLIRNTKYLLCSFKP